MNTELALAKNKATGLTEFVPPSTDRMFPTYRRPKPRTIDISQSMDTLMAWAKGVKVGLGPAIPKSYMHEVLLTLWTYRDLGSSGLQDLGPPTDLLIYRVHLKSGTPTHRAQPRRMTMQKEWWLRKFATEEIQAGMYERTMIANGELYYAGLGVDHSPSSLNSIVGLQGGMLQHGSYLNYVAMCLFDQTHFVATALGAVVVSVTVASKSEASLEHDSPFGSPTTIVNLHHRSPQISTPRADPDPPHDGQRDKDLWCGRSPARQRSGQLDGLNVAYSRQPIT
ncbi:hypothetical protein TI39_contig494g00005 [Zymoseptoria brevis]|uniref:Uncharacterized protein n=1 Tax=Zymoseptoria brevis TaxID=1047168 RepID=A0A0F4GJ28_9PEZI|nr:hypothetical protein TI39_contig494g00005 [Zymoseptoria brevis]